MSYWHGVFWSLAAAAAHTGVDVLRKHGSGKIPPGDLVALVTVFDAVIATTAVGIFEGYSDLQFTDSARFTWVVVSSALLLLLSKYMYQLALHNSPLSLVAPYLAFTPALLVIVAFIFIGEVPSVWGLVGVAVVTMSGFLLGLRAGSEAPSSPSKGKAPAAYDIAAHSSWQALKPSDSRTVWALTFYKDRSLALQQDGDKLPSRHPPTAQLPSESGRRYLLHPQPSKLRQSLFQLVTAPPPHLGPVIVLVVAAIWSVTASLDKMGIMAAPSTAIYFVVQRLVIGAAGLLFLLVTRPSSFRYCCTHFGLLCSISLMEQAAVAFFLLAIRNILVSYVVAIKRVNVLMSTVLACVIFKESVASRLPYIFCMLGGMLIIVLQPGHENLDHSHHTRL